MFLHMIGSEARRIIKASRVQPSNLLETMDVALREFGTRKTVLKERQKFRNIKQEGSVKDFANKLKIEIRNCHYRANEEEMLIDQFIAGMKDHKAKRKVLLLDSIDFYKLVQLTEIEEEVGIEINPMEVQGEVQ